MHSGGDTGSIHGQFRYLNDQFHCGQINILLALTDIGPDDGATTLIPGSHKSNLTHPFMKVDYVDLMDTSMDDVEASIKIHMRASDVILFVDSLAHGSARRTHSGERRILVYRYSPRWGNTRFGYRPSDALLERLTPERRQIIQPIEPRHPDS